MILADTGPLVALMDSHDPWHQRSVDFVTGAREEIRIPGTVLAEAGYFLGTRLGAGAEARFLRTLGSGEFTVIDPLLADYARAAGLVEQYADFPLGTVDAVIAAMAERLEVTTLFTLDRRHFGAIRPKHCASFTLVP